MAVTWWDLPTRSRMNGTFFDAMAEAGTAPPATVPSGPPIFRFSDPLALRALLAGAGLADVEVSTHTWTFRVADLDRWWEGGLGGMMRMAAILTAQPENVQRKTRAAFDRLGGAYAVPGGYDVPNSALVGVGVKR